MQVTMSRSLNVSLNPDHFRSALALSEASRCSRYYYARYLHPSTQYSRFIPIRIMQVVAMAKKTAKPAPKARSASRTANIEW